MHALPVDLIPAGAVGKGFSRGPGHSKSAPRTALKAPHRSLEKGSSHLLGPGQVYESQMPGCNWHEDCLKAVWGLSKIIAPLGVLIIKIIVYWGLVWGPLFMGPPMYSGLSFWGPLKKNGQTSLGPLKRRCYWDPRYLGFVSFRPREGRQLPGCC